MLSNDYTVYNYNIESKLNEKYEHSRSNEKFIGPIVVGLPEMGH